MHRTFRTVYAFAYSRLRRHDAAEDATQEAYLRAYRQLDRCPPPAEFLPWIITFARNCVSEQMRRDRPRPAPPAAAGPPADPALPEAVRAAIAELDDRPRLLLTLKYVNGLSVAQIAERLGLTVSAVKVALFRAYEAIRTKVAAHDLR